VTLTLASANSPPQTRARHDAGAEAYLHISTVHIAGMQPATIKHTRESAGHRCEPMPVFSLLPPFGARGSGSDNAPLAQFLWVAPTVLPATVGETAHRSNWALPPCSHVSLAMPAHLLPTSQLAQCVVIPLWQTVWGSPQLPVTPALHWTD